MLPFDKRKPDAKVKIGIDMDDYYRIRENAERSQFYGKEKCKKHEGLWTEWL